VLTHDEEQADKADAIYVFDPVLITDHGAVILSLGKELRRGEETSMQRRLEALRIPTLFTMVGSGRAEGGDMFWLDEATLAVGVGFRTNREGIRQLQTGLRDLGIEVFPVELPYHSGPVACLHLLSLISMVDADLAVAYPPLLSVPFWQELRHRGIQIVEVPDSEFSTMGPNVLALAPRRCLMLEGNPITRERLEAAGCSVDTYRGNEISLKGEGGPTCLTRPLLRSV
jgi:N-dimethylarginine dimethylaminohydrolase